MQMLTSSFKRAIAEKKFWDTYMSSEFKWILSTSDVMWEGPHNFFGWEYDISQRYIEPLNDLVSHGINKFADNR